MSFQTNSLSLFNVIEKKEKANIGNLKVYSSEDFGDIYTKDDELMFCQKDDFVFNEMLVHSALCNHPSVKDVLLIGYNDGAISEILRHEEINIDVLEKDEKTKEDMSKYFKTSFDKSVNFIFDDISKISTDKIYDVIFFPQSNSDKHLFYQIQNLLKPDGLLITKAPNNLSDIKAQKEVLSSLDEYFKIIMPFTFNINLAPFGLNTFVFCSNKFHPTADILLQKADLIDNLKYYNADLHKASFTISTSIEKELRGFIKK